jgi:hypothetical protein
MAVWGFYADSRYGWAQNESATWTDDFEFAPANVYATAMLTGILVSNNGFLYSGIAEYRTKNPKTGKHKVVSTGHLDTTFGIAEVIIENNVDRVTFGMGIWDQGGGDWPSRADAVHQVWLYD